MLQLAVCLRGFFRDPCEQSEYLLKLTFGLFLGVCLYEILHVTQFPEIGPVGGLFKPHFALKLDYIALLVKNVLNFRQSLPKLDHLILLNFVPIDSQTISRARMNADECLFLVGDFTIERRLFGNVNVRLV